MLSEVIMRPFMKSTEAENPHINEIQEHARTH